MALPHKILTEKPLVIIDTESTSPEPTEAHVVEIAMVVVNGGVVGEKWTSFVRPPAPIPKEATAIHGITDADVLMAPSFAALAPEIRRRLQDRIVVGYNVCHYDLPLLHAEFARAQEAIVVSGALDVLTFVRHFDRYVPGRGRHKLAKTAERHKVSVGDAHRAMADCRMAWGVLWRLTEKYPEFFNRSWLSLMQWQTDAQRQQEADYQRFKAERERIVRQEETG